MAHCRASLNFTQRNMLTVDFHVHTIASVHALSTIDELLRQAEKNGMAGFAVTDHSPGIDNTLWLMQNKPGQHNWTEQIKGPDLPYFMTMLFRYQKPAEVKVTLLKGIECNILSDGDPTDVPSFLAHHFDVVIASIHPLPHLFNIVSSEQITERMILALNDPIDIIGHPYHKNYSPIIEPLVIAAGEKEIALELNNSSLQLGKADIEGVRMMLTLAKKHDCRISLSSDAHMSNELGDDKMIVQLLKETEFPDELIVNHSLEAAIRFVKERKTIRDTLKAS